MPDSADRDGFVPELLAVKGKVGRCATKGLAVREDIEEQLTDADDSILLHWVESIDRVCGWIG